jgi:hypothetical protein
VSRSTPPLLMGLAIVCALAVHPLLGLVLVPVIYAIEAARKKAAIGKVVASHGSVDALKADIEARTQHLHGLYRQHNVPQEDWKH